MSQTKRRTTSVKHRIKERMFISKCAPGRRKGQQKKRKSVCVGITEAQDASVGPQRDGEVKSGRTKTTKTETSFI